MQTHTKAGPTKCLSVTVITHVLWHFRCSVTNITHVLWHFWWGSYWGETHWHRDVCGLLLCRPWDAYTPLCPCVVLPHLYHSRHLSPCSAEQSPLYYNIVLCLEPQLGVGEWSVAHAYSPWTCWFRPCRLYQLRIVLLKVSFTFLLFFHFWITVDFLMASSFPLITTRAGPNIGVECFGVVANQSQKWWLLTTCTYST